MHSASYMEKGPPQSNLAATIMSSDLWGMPTSELSLISALWQAPEGSSWCFLPSLRTRGGGTIPHLIQTLSSGGGPTEHCQSKTN